MLPVTKVCPVLVRKDSIVEGNAVKFPGKVEVYFQPSDSNHFKGFSLHLEKYFVTSEKPRMLEDKDGKQHTA